MQESPAEMNGVFEGEFAPQQPLQPLSNPAVLRSTLRHPIYVHRYRIFYRMAGMGCGLWIILNCHFALHILSLEAEVYEIISVQHSPFPRPPPSFPLQQNDDRGRRLHHRWFGQHQPEVSVWL